MGWDAEQVEDEFYAQGGVDRVLDERPKPASVPAMLRQGYWWPSAEGWVRVERMDLPHALNSAALLLRKAAAYKHAELIEVAGAAADMDEAGHGDHMHEAGELAAMDPVVWMRTTTMWRSLVRRARKGDPT